MVIPTTKSILAGLSGDFREATTAFYGDDQSFNDLNHNEIRKSFQILRSNAQLYGLLGSENNFNVNFSPSNVGAVGKTKKPLIPMMISLIPPDLYPSGQYQKSYFYPSPADLDTKITSISSRAVEARDAFNVEAGDVPLESLLTFPNVLFPHITGYDNKGNPIHRFPQSFPLYVQFTREDGRTTDREAGVKLEWSSRDPDVATVDQRGVVTIRKLGETFIDVVATLPDGKIRKSNSAVFNSREKAIESGWDWREDFEGAPEANVLFQQTEVPILRSDDDQWTEEKFAKELGQRYLNFQSNAQKAYKNIDRKNTNIVEGRQEVVDPYEDDPNILKARSYNDEDYIRNQVQLMYDLPPLIMYTNFTEFSIAYEQILSDGNKGRDGFIVEHWGLQQPRFNASGHIGATYIHKTDELGRAAGGVTRALRRGSAAYQSFMSLFQIYKNNGAIYNSHNRIATLGSVKIFYDNTIYTGSFETISVTETEDKPFDLSFAFSFVIRFIDKISPQS